MRREAMSVWCLVAVVFCFAAGAPSRGDEPKCQCPEQGVPILSNLPYVSRLFKSVGVLHEPGCEAGQCQKTPCADQFERIGIDFNVCQEYPDAHVLRFGPIGLAVGWDAPGACAGSQCPPCQTCPVDAPAKLALCCPGGHCGAACCGAHCCAVKCAAHVTSACKCAEGGGACKCADHVATACKCADRDELIDQIIELTAEKAAAEGALEAHEIVHEMLGEMTELVAKNAALEARLEAQAENAKLNEKLIALAADNARLKSQVELAEVKYMLMKQTAGIEIENQMLARRVGELEARLSAAETGTRSAKKSETEHAR